MKQPDFDKAFAPTPEIVSLSIEDAIRKGEKAMKLRHKITAMLSAAAVLAIVCTAAVFALPNDPRPDVVSQPKLIELTEEPTVYYTSKGVYYHNIEDCSGMMNAQPHPLSEAQSDGKIACPVCVEPSPRTQASIMDAPVYYNTNGTWYHYEEHCSGMMNAKPHTYFEAKADGKEPCPTCVGEWVFGFEGAPETTAAPVLYDSSVTMDESVPLPAEHMCSIGLDYFMEIFDHGLFATFPHSDMEGSGKQTGDYLVEEAVYTNENGAYVAVYREMKADTLMSGRIAIIFPEGFDHDLFSSEGAQWYRSTYALAMETLVNMPMNSNSALSDALTQIYVYFDGEVKPTVCEMEFETEDGFFSLSFDIDGHESSLATMNYNTSKA